MTSVARALETDETRGFMKPLVDAESGRMLGAAVLAVEGGEIMSVLELAMMGKLPSAGWNFRPSNTAESLNNLFMTLD